LNKNMHNNIPSYNIVLNDIIVKFCTIFVKKICAKDKFFRHSIYQKSIGILDEE